MDSVSRLQAHVARRIFQPQKLLAMANEDEQLISGTEAPAKIRWRAMCLPGSLLASLPLGLNSRLCSGVRLLGLGFWLGARYGHEQSHHQLMLPLQPQIRQLFDVNLFDHVGEPYKQYPVESKIITTECVIDTVQATTYLGEAVVNIYRAEICPDDEPLGCTAPVAHAITSFLWIMAFLTSATSTCAESLQQGGSCAAALLRDLATAGSTIYGFDEDCFLTNPRETSWRVYQRWWEHLAPAESRRLRATKEGNVSAYRKRREELSGRLRELTQPEHGGRANLPNVLFSASVKGIPRELIHANTIEAISGKRNYHTERNFALANCVFDSVAATTWLMRALLSIEEATRNCPEPKACTVDVLYATRMHSDGFFILFHSRRGLGSCLLCGANLVSSLCRLPQQRQT